MVGKMKTMPRLLLLLFCLSVFTMMFIARCGFNMESQMVNPSPWGLSSSSSATPGEKALREVMRRKEVEHIRDKSAMQEKIKLLESQLEKVQGQVVNLTANLDSVNSQRERDAMSDDKAKDNDGYSNNDKSMYLWNAGVALQDEDVESEGRQWFGPAQKDFKLMESLGDRHIAEPYNKDGRASDLQNANGIWSQEEDNGFQRHGLPVGGNSGRVVAKNDGNPVIDMSLRNRPLYNPGLGPNSKDRTKYNFGPRQDLLEDAHFSDRDDAQVFRDRIPPRRAGAGLEHADRRADIQQDGRMLNVGNGVAGVEERGRILRVPRGVDDGDIVDKAEQIYIDPAVGQTAVVDSQNLNGGKDQQKRQKKNVNPAAPQPNAGQNNRAEDFDLYVKERMEASEVLHGQSYKTEYEMISFNRFIMNRIYMVDPGLGKRVVEKPIGSKKKDINEILFQAVAKLNSNRTGTGLTRYTYDHFVEGIYRIEPASGAHYELYFKNLDDTNAFQQQHRQSHLYTNSYVRITLFRPFAPPQLVQQSVVNTGPEWINLVLPLSGRVDTFIGFMDQFISVCINQDRRVYLTVVYFGSEGLKEVKAIMSRTAKKYRFKHMKLVTLNETFARGRGLQIGTLNWKGGGDVLMFFCDVDIMFTAEFFERCRLNSERGKRVYYPIVFSLYNPKIVYSLQDIPTPSLLDQLVLSKDTGFWRDFGYGMTCQYRSDFLKLKGFDEQIQGWGGEDVSLYQKFVRSEYFVVRATDPAIFHLWHEKSCDPNLSGEQYRSCIRSKALNEASHSQLGLLAFKDEIDVHRSVKERNKLLLRNAAMGGGAAAAPSNLDAKRKQQLSLLNSRLAKLPA